MNGQLQRAIAAALTGAAVALLLVIAGCAEASSDQVTIWMEPPSRFRLEELESAPLPLPVDGDGAEYLAGVLREALAESGNPGVLTVRATHMSWPATDGDFFILRRAACLAGVERFDLHAVSPQHPYAEGMPYDTVAAAPFDPPLCGAAPLVPRANEISRREFLPEPPD